MNRTLLLAMLSRCGKVIQEELDNAAATGPASTAVPASTARKSYDNAYFYILFVMFFYCFLTLALLKKARKDPCEEVTAGGLKLNTGPEAMEGFDFEDECAL